MLACGAALAVPAAAGASSPFSHVATPYVEPYAWATAPTGFSPAQINAFYGWSGAGGAGQTIALVDAYSQPAIASDLAAFSTRFGLPPAKLDVVQPFGTAAPVVGWGMEISLDVEWAHAIAPTATIMLVEVPTATFGNLLNGVQWAAQHGAKYVSMSWGMQAFTGEAIGDPFFTQPGVSYFAAAGDVGGVVTYPSSSRNVVAVGGTTLVTGPTGQWQGEQAWSTGGGGIFGGEPPSSAQAANASYDAYAASQGLRPVFRGTPDISLDANPATGVPIYDTSARATAPWIQVGGTSVSSPLAAAHAAALGVTVNQTTVYSGALSIYDITAGSNGNAAVPGWDGATGLGSWSTAHGTVSAPTPPATPPTGVSDIVGTASVPGGYYVAGADGAVFTSGSARAFGSMAGKPLTSPIVGIAATADGGGYWLVAADGGVFAFGDAAFHGSMGGSHLNQPIVGIAPDATTGGYWEVAADGGIFSFDAPFYGSMGGSHLNQPIVGMAATATGGGYWLVAKDGGIFTFGNARFYGSTGAMHLNAPITGMAPGPGGHGYWLVASDGGIFTFGDAPYDGSVPGLGLSLSDAVGIAPADAAYSIVTATGRVFIFT